MYGDTVSQLEVVLLSGGVQYRGCGKGYSGIGGAVRGNVDQPVPIFRRRLGVVGS